MPDVRSTASETEASALPVREFGTVCRVACEHLTSATNILRHYWRHICLTRPRRFVTFYISALEILLLTYHPHFCPYHYLLPPPLTLFIRRCEHIVNIFVCRVCSRLLVTLSRLSGLPLYHLGLSISLAVLRDFSVFYLYHNARIALIAN